MTEEPRLGLTDDESVLWRGFLGWKERITADIERELLQRAGVSAAEFEVLVRLAEAPDSQLDQGVLGASIAWSASRLSHQLRRMANRGLIEREGTGTGRRMRLRMTHEGARVLRASLPVHADAVRRHFLGPMTPGQRRALEGAMSGREAETHQRRGRVGPTAGTGRGLGYERAGAPQTAAAGERQTRP